MHSANEKSLLFMSKDSVWYKM